MHSMQGHEMTLGPLLSIAAVFSLFLWPGSLLAGWALQKIDADPTTAIVSFLEGDYIAYQKDSPIDHDILLYQITTGQITEVTQDTDYDDHLMALKDGRVWFISVKEDPNPNLIYGFNVQTRQTFLAGSFQYAFEDYWGGAQGDHCVANINHDWWRCRETGQPEQLTFSGYDIFKIHGGVSGDYLIWIGSSDYYHSEVYCTNMPAQATQPITNDTDYHYSSLCVDGNDAIWVKHYSLEGEGAQIYHYTIPTGHTEIVGEIGGAYGVGDSDVALEYPLLVWVKVTGSYPDAKYHLMTYDLQTRSTLTLKVSDLEIHSPRIRDNDILYSANHCPYETHDVDTCWELHHLDLSTGASGRLTTYGRGNRIECSAVDSGILAFSQYNWRTHNNLYLGYKTKDPLCGVIAQTSCDEGLVNMGIVLLLPLLASAQYRIRMNGRNRKGSLIHQAIPYAVKQRRTMQ